MNIPNLLTLLRIILVPIIVIMLMQGLFVNALILFALAGITDGLDGFLARALRQQTVLGAYLDPLADKALLTTSYVALSVLGVIPGWLAVIVISRDFIILFGISILFVMSVSFDIKQAYVSKITTVAQFFVIVIALVVKCSPGLLNLLVMDVLFWITALLTVISGLHYISRGVHYINSAGQLGHELHSCMFFKNVPCS